MWRPASRLQLHFRVGWLAKLQRWKSSVGSSGSGTQWSVQVERIDPGQLDLAHSFQVAIYENLLEELNKTKRFKQVLPRGRQ